MTRELRRRLDEWNARALAVLAAYEQTTQEPTKGKG